MSFKEGDSPRMIPGSSQDNAWNVAGFLAHFRPLSICQLVGSRVVIYARPLGLSAVSLPFEGSAFSPRGHAIIVIYHIRARSGIVADRHQRGDVFSDHSSARGPPSACIDRLGGGGWPIVLRGLPARHLPNIAGCPVWPYDVSFDPSSFPQILTTSACLLGF